MNRPLLQPLPELVLRDIHQPQAPSWWPPAPGWWIVAGLVLLAIAIPAWLAWRRRQRMRALTRLFDRNVGAANGPAAQVAAMSELLRRAARHGDPAADRLQGEAWLRFLQHADRRAPLSAAQAQLLLDGGYRRQVDSDAVAALLPAARARFLQWMAVR